MSSYSNAAEQYRGVGVNTEDALKVLQETAISLHCWQADDVGGFETPDAVLDGGGIQVTGNYPGKARTLNELREDIEKAISMIPGKQRLNLHASYGDFQGEKVDRDAIEPDHFQSWADWSKSNKIPMDFNATLFSHPMADSGFTLSHHDKNVRDFWIEHVKRARKIGEFFGKEQGSPSVHNIWIPDGTKDTPVDRMGYRKRLIESLDEIFTLKLQEQHLRDAVESKLFGIDSEAFVVGSHEFYMGYALTRNKLICLDLGHFHPTESIADKISAIFQFQKELLLHVSRPMRWDSDHVVILNDDILLLMQELKRSGYLSNTHIGLDFFDATINRIGAMATGARSALKGLLIALLEPTEKLINFEREENYYGRMALLEQLKTLPWGEVWNEFCRRNDVPEEAQLYPAIQEYEEGVLKNRV